MATLGRRNLLSINRESAPGLYLNGGELGEILLPGRYIPKNLQPGDKLDVFVYLDSEDRLVATTETPLAVVGEIASLKVVATHPRAGAFLNWGLAKDLLLPFSEQDGPVSIGENVVVAVCLDARSGRIIASAKLQRHLRAAPPQYTVGQPVQLLVTRRTPLGCTVIVEESHLGLLYLDHFTTPPAIGETVTGYVRKVRDDGKIDLGLDAAGYRRVLPLKLQIVNALKENGGKLELDDEASPAAVREKFGVSKKAFKQALGALYKSRRIRFLKPGIELLDTSSWTPGQ
jgi:predicted RNA-binding protein (virulence factor B family)